MKLILKCMFPDYDCFSFNEECNLIACIEMFSNCNSALLLTHQNITQHMSRMHTDQTALNSSIL